VALRRPRECQLAKYHSATGLPLTLADMLPQSEVLVNIRYITSWDQIFPLC